MPKVIKFSESSLSKTRSKGNMRVGANSHDYGTSYYSMVEPPAGGYTVYQNKASGGPSIHVANNEAELINITREISGTTYNSALECLNYFRGQSDKMVVSSEDGFENTVTDGLVLELNAKNNASFIDNEPTTNLQPNSVAVGHNSGGYGNVVTVTDATSEKGPGWKKVTISNRGSNFRIIQWTYLVMSANTTYCHSAVFDWGNMRDKGYYLHFDGTGTGTRTYYANNNYNTPYTSNPPINSSLLDGRLAGTIVHTSTHNHAFFISNPTTGVSGLNDYFYYKNFQSETVFPPTSYTTGSRSQNTTWYDLSGNGYNAILTNGPTFDSSSKASIVYDGTNDWVYVPSQTAFNSLVNNFTVMGLVNPSSAGYGFNGQRLFGLGYVAQWQLELRNDNGRRLSVNYRQNSTNYFQSNGPNITQDKWNHVGLIVNNGVAQYILNGKTYSGFTIAQDFVPSGQPFSVGNYNGAGDGAYNGKISSCQLYNRVLTDSEIKQNYYQAPIVTDGLVFAADAGNLMSYENGSTTVYSMTGSLSGSLINGTGYSSDNGGTWTFDGVNDSILFTGLASQTISEGSFFFWSTCNSTSFFQSPMGWHRGEWSLRASQTYLYLGWGSTEKSVGFSSTGTSWRYLGVTISNGTANFYLNGISIGTGTGYPSNTTAPTSIYLGRRNHGTGYWYDGNITAAQVYYRALTASEILQNFNAQRHRFGI